MFFGATPEYSRSSQPRNFNPGPGLCRHGLCTGHVERDSTSRPSSALPSAPEGAFGPTLLTRRLAQSMHTLSRHLVRCRRPRRSDDQRIGSTRRSNRPRTSPFGDAELRPEGRVTRSRETQKRLAASSTPRGVHGSRSALDARLDTSPTEVDSVTNPRSSSFGRLTEVKRPRLHASPSTHPNHPPPIIRSHRDGPKTTGDKARGDAPRRPRLRSLRRSAWSAGPPRGATVSGPFDPPKQTVQRYTVGSFPRSDLATRRRADRADSEESTLRFLTPAPPKLHGRDEPHERPTKPQAARCGARKKPTTRRVPNTPEGVYQAASSPLTEASDNDASPSRSHPKVQPVHVADPKVCVACASRAEARLAPTASKRATLAHPKVRSSVPRAP